MAPGETRAIGAIFRRAACCPARPYARTRHRFWFATITAPVHIHATPPGDALALAARGLVESAGEQWTSLRGEVFAALAGFGCPASAYDVAEAASARMARRITANSVYRMLCLE